MRSRFASARIIGLAVLALATQDAPASAQGFFNWFGGGGNQRQQQRQIHGSAGVNGGRIPGLASASRTPQQPTPITIRARPTSDRYGPATAAFDRRQHRTLRSRTACALCDGRYFPMQRHANANPVAALQVVLSRRRRRRSSTAARSTTRSATTARATPISTTRSSIARRSSRAAPATARTRSDLRRSTSRTIRRCGRATSLRPATT